MGRHFRWYPRPSEGRPPPLRARVGHVRWYRRVRQWYGETVALSEVVEVLFTSASRLTVRARTTGDTYEVDRRDFEANSMMCGGSLARRRGK